MRENEARQETWSECARSTEAAFLRRSTRSMPRDMMPLCSACRCCDGVELEEDIIRCDVQ